MSVQRFSTGKQFVWCGVTYEVQRLLPGSQLVLACVETAERQTVPFTELAQALFAGELHFIDRNAAMDTALKGQPPTLSDYPPHLRALAEYRLDVIRPLLALRPGHRSRKQVAERVQEIRQAREEGTASPSTAISVASVYRWIRVYERSGHDVRALVGNSQEQGGKGQSLLAEEVEAILHTVIQDRWHVSEQVTCDDIYLEVALRIAEENRFRHDGEKLDTPSRTTVWRRIDALDEKEKLIAKRGRRAAQREMTQYGQMDYPRIPLGRVEIDHTPMDLIVVDGHDNLPLGRPTLTYCLDTTTRYPLGFYVGFDPPSYLTVMECLYHAILAKEDVREVHNTEHDWIAYGIPAVLIVDNGKEFIGNDLEDACHSLGIELLRMPLRTPHFKAAVERMFRTLNTGLLHTLPGTTFSNPQQRGDYDSVAEACIDLDDLLHVLHLFLLDVYAESFHRGLGAIPARRWEAITREGFFPRVPASAEELKVLLGRVAHRVIHRYGIEFLRLRYNSRDLAPLRNALGTTRAKIKYDPSDLGSIHVYDPQHQHYVEVACLNQEYAQGLSLWKHRVILNLARREEAQVDILALARAKRRIQEIVERSRATKKVKRRARIARWQSGEEPEARQAEEALPPVFPPPATEHPDLSSLGLELPVTLEDLEDEEWRVGYDLPDTDPSDRLR
jgi:putative transposase